MSDLSQISEDIPNKNEQQEETALLTNDESKMISVSNKKTKPLENHTNKTEDEFESKKSVETTEYDKSDSEYEDVEKDESDDINDTSVSPKTSFKTTTDEDELHINIKPRRINKKRQDDEHSEGCEDDDNQNVPTIKEKLIRVVKNSDTNKELPDDDNNTQSPAYIPRKGKFYEHDDRTLNENDQSKQEISKNEYRVYRDSEAKWQHDLYFQDQQRNSRDRFQRSSHDANREHLHLNDYMFRSQKVHDDYQEQKYCNNSRRQIPHENYKKPQNDRMISFDLKDYDRPLSYNRNGYNRDTTIHKEAQTTPRRQRRDNDPYQIDERTFHRRRSFTNSQLQQQDNGLKFDNNPNRNGLRRLDEHGRRNEVYENKNKLPPRLQINNNNRNLIQYQQNLSTDVSSNERPKRYSSMRNNMTNSIQRYQDQRSNNVEQNDWPQAPPPPTSYLPQQIMTPQMFYQQQSSRYIPMNYSQTSISQQFQENKSYETINQVL